MSVNRFIFDLKFLTEILPVLTLMGLGGSIAFNYGYFILPFNSGLFILNTQDLALTFLYVLAFILIFASFYFNFQDAMKNNGVLRWILLVVVVLGILFPSVKELAVNGLIIDNWASIKAWFMFGTALSILIFFGSTYVTIARPHAYRVAQASMVFFTCAGLFCFGAVQFINDFSVARLVDIRTDSATQSVALITVRNSFMLAIDPSNCSLLVIDRQRFSELTAPLSVGTFGTIDLKNRCPVK